MPLTPIDVQQQTFKVALRGYAEDEVDEFLDEVVISLRDYEQRLRDSQERVAVLEEQLAANRETEEAMRRTFLAAQRTADSIVQEAKTESERLLTDARSEVERVTFEQTEEKAKLLAETARLRDQVHGLRTALTDLAGGTLGRLAEIDTDAVTERITGSVTPLAETDIEPEVGVSLPADDEEVDEEVDDEGDDEVDIEPEHRFFREAAFEDDQPDAAGDDVEIAKVPDWITGSDPDADDLQPELRRPWERDR